MRRPGVRFALTLAALAFSGAARADEIGGEGFAVPAPALSWKQAEKRLIVQLRAAAEPVAEGSIFRQDVPTTRTVLMLLPESGLDGAEDVTITEAAAWGKRTEELFRAGRENLLRRLPPSVRTTPELRRGVKVNLFYGEHPFAAAYALAVADYPRCRGKYGVLVAVPNRHAMLCYPVESSRAFHAYLALVNLAVDIHVSGEAPIAPHVFWVHERVWETQQVTLEERSFHTQRTPGFDELLKGLPRDIHDTGARRR